MARDFEDHCWKDVIPPDVLEIYAAYKREVYVGRNPALLAIDAIAGDVLHYLPEDERPTREELMPPGAALLFGQAKAEAVRSMIADVVDVDRAMHRQQRAGMFFAFHAAMDKVGMALGLFVALDCSSLLSL